MKSLLLLESQVMAKKSGHGGSRSGAGRPRTERDDMAVKVDRAIVTRAHYVAKARGISLAEYLSDLLLPLVERDFAKESKRLAPPPEKEGE